MQILVSFSFFLGCGFFVGNVQFSHIRFCADANVPFGLIYALSRPVKWPDYRIVKMDGLAEKHTDILFYVASRASGLVASEWHMPLFTEISVVKVSGTSALDGLWL